MSKWVKSLLNPACIRTIVGGSREGNVGMLAGRLGPDRATWPKKKLKHWMEGRSQILWGWQGERLLLLAVRLPEDENRRKAVRPELEAQLRGIVAEDMGDDAAIGFGYILLPPRAQGHSAEQLLLEGMLEAGALAYKSLSEAKARVPEPSVKPSKKTADAKAAEPWSEGEPGLTVGRLATAMAAMPPETPVSAAAEWFEEQPDSHSIVVVIAGQPRGLITRDRLNRMLASKFGMPLYWNRTIDKIMENAPLVADADMQVEAVARLAMDRSDSQLYDTVIVTEQGRYVGGVTVKALLESFASLQAEAARRVNPLTGLPGGDIIRREIEARIKMRKPFSVYYADLDYFKWFNDSYGYSAGDDMIRYTASVLDGGLNQEDGSDHFLGHIGGDDFISISDRPDPEARCRAFIDRFHAGVDPMYGTARPTTVLDRHGGAVQQPGVSLSIAVIRWDGSGTVSHEELSRLAAACKKKAKELPGSAYAVIEAFAATYEERA
ncbi:diguanylate cyclase (GGDEF) domain-containing protein [Cohnella sp. OV330]|uniref:diguanylate cyclase domain-containing protein n=1 Tax=Cohnella sp. OV330 TaxID=1855288 RepID=UPI0008EFE1E0|nr:diguanylate cyclase [Cohnella sp. OV330]SFB30551.1 diguanylate cyclase (GGDEF) domain-containing protein [Cohnella sp. OV330]